MRFYQCYLDQIILDEDHIFVWASIKSGASHFNTTNNSSRKDPAHGVHSFDGLQYQYLGDPARQNSERKTCNFGSPCMLFLRAAGVH